MDKRKIKNAMALIGLMGILLYGACGSEKKEIPKQIYIGVACYDQRDTFLGELLEDFKRECRTLEKRGYDISLTIMDAANSQRTQDDQVQEMIGNGCDILCVNWQTGRIRRRSLQPHRSMISPLYFLIGNLWKKI